VATGTDNGRGCRTLDHPKSVSSAVTGKDSGTATLKGPGESSFAATVGEKANGEKGARRKGREDVHLACCYR
jgi:hypothetical protein